jgi:hypothetical protein
MVLNVSECGYWVGVTFHFADIASPSSSQELLVDVGSLDGEPAVGVSVEVVGVLEG